MAAQLHRSCSIPMHFVPLYVFCSRIEQKGKTVQKMSRRAVFENFSHRTPSTDTHSHLDLEIDQKMSKIPDFEPNENGSP